MLDVKEVSNVVSQKKSSEVLLSKTISSDIDLN